MKNILIKIILFVSFLFLIAYQAIIIRATSKTLNEKENKILTQVHNLNTLKEMLTEEWQIEGTKYVDKIITDERGNNINIDSIALNKPVLVFRFSKVDCSKCVIDQIDIIKELIRKNDINYLMVCDYKNQRNLGLFKRINEIDNEVYDCTKLLKNEKRTPYFFVYSKGIVYDIFFPDDDFMDLTKIYLNSVSNKYFVSVP